MSFLRLGQPMDKVELRDHLQNMPEAIAADLALPQTALEEIAKSKGENNSPATELADALQIFNDTVHISATIGITLSPQHATTAEQLFKNADQAMYMAKNSVRNQFRFFKPTQT